MIFKIFKCSACEHQATYFIISYDLGLCIGYCNGCISYAKGHVNHKFQRWKAISEDEMKTLQVIES